VREEYRNAGPAIERALLRAVEGSEDEAARMAWEALKGPLEAARNAAVSRERYSLGRGKREVTFADVVRERIREHRERARLTQAQLANQMMLSGFGWKRITVTEVELGKRRVSLEELAALAGWFGVPMASFFLPGDRDLLKLRRLVNAEGARDLILGAEATLGESIPMKIRGDASGTAIVTAGTHTVIVAEPVTTPSTTGPPGESTIGRKEPK
jgi:transcriptional regulator with XRE-family HTH domain